MIILYYFPFINYHFYTVKLLDTVGCFKQWDQDLSKNNPDEPKTLTARFACFLACVWFPLYGFRHEPKLRSGGVVYKHCLGKPSKGQPIRIKCAFREVWLKERHVSLG